MADAGMFLSFLDWIAQGGRALSRIKPVVDEFRYIVRLRPSVLCEPGRTDIPRPPDHVEMQVASPGGFRVSASLDDARVHIVSSFEDAEADAFIVEGVIRVGYGHASGRCQFSFDASDVQLLSHRSSGGGPRSPNRSALGASPRNLNEAFIDDDEDQFADPDWQDKAVLAPSNASFVYAWRVLGTPGDDEPASMSLHLSQATLALSHEDAKMLGTVRTTLLETLRNRPGAPPRPPPRAPRPPQSVVMNMSIEIPSINLSLGARNESSHLMEVRLVASFPRENDPPCPPLVWDRYTRLTN